MGILTLVSKLLRRHARSRFVLEGRNEAEGIGGPVMPPMQSHLQSQVAPLWEMSLLTKHYNPDVRKSAQALASLETNTSKISEGARAALQRQSLNLAATKPEDVVAAYDESHGAFNPQPSSTPQMRSRKRRRKKASAGTNV